MRDIRLLNAGWEFTGPEGTEPVELPHTWNAKDGQDGGNDYYRGCCSYKRVLRREEIPAGNAVYLEIQGANASGEVYLDGVLLASHDGGYSAWRVSLGALSGGERLEIRVDNSPNDRVYPQMADFTFYGGLYRDVYLIGVEESHFDLTDSGSCGLYVTPVLKDGEAEVSLEARLQAKEQAAVRFRILDAQGRSIAEKVCRADSPTCTLSIKEPRLWNGRKDPYLYTASVELTENGRVLDCVSSRFGCRSFALDPERGFLLNGEVYPLRGVSRHQDWEGIGNALRPEHHARDIGLILELGATTVRLAHYQHSQTFYDLCDEKGLVVWAEIPYISKHLPEGTENTLTAMEELIRQNYNHACIAVWGLSNEITMNGEKDPALLENHRRLNELCHRLDPLRKTAVAALTMCSPDAEYLRIPDAVSYNHYFGWYGGKVEQNGPWLDDFHREHPNTPIGLSEYGCEALDWHSDRPVQGDYTEEYQAYYHEEMIRQLDARPYLWATHVWNMFDFGADARAEGGENGRNHKGLVTFDRAYKKDAFYAYKAWLSEEPFVHIAGKRFVNRTGPVSQIKVYSNLPEVELFRNGESLGRKQGKWFFSFEVPNEGESKLRAAAYKGTVLCEDEALIRSCAAPDETYIFRESGAVLNWFDVTAPEGRFSLLDSVADIMKTAEGAAVIGSLLHGLTAAEQDGEKKAGGFEMTDDIRKMIMGFTVIRLLSLSGSEAGAGLGREEALELNRRLNAIRKP